MVYKAFCLGFDTHNLRHCENGAQSLADALHSNSYDVIIPPRKKSEFTISFENFIDSANSSDVGVLYLSGHGLMQRGSFYLILGEDVTKQANLLNLNVWLDQFSQSNFKNKLVILDCCHAMKGVDDLSLNCDDRLVIFAASGRLEKTIEWNSTGSYFTNQICDVFQRSNTDPRKRKIDVGLLCSEVTEHIKSHNSASPIILPLPKIVGNLANFDLIDPTEKNSAADILMARESRRLDRIEDDYRELLLRNCDIVSLTNLPGQDRHLLLRTLELRRLYVPLRFWVDVKASEELKEADWDGLELRRQVSNGLQTQGTGISTKKDQKERSAIGPRLAETKRIVVLGDPGSGKTTLIRWLATAYLLRSKNKQAWLDLPDVSTLPDVDVLPIVIRCRDLERANTAETLDDILAHTLRKSETEPDRIEELKTILRSRITSGNALIMLDGLDEISDPTRRANLCYQVEQIHVAYPKAMIIITSRIVGYREMGTRLGRGFEHVTLADLNPTEKNDFVKRWCDLTELPAIAKEAAQELIDDVHSSDRIEQLTGNPMLLTTMALVKRKVGKLPNRRADLYSEAVQVLLNWRSDLGKKVDSYEALPQLEYIAHAMCLRGVQRMRRSQILQLLSEMRLNFLNLHPIRARPPEDFLDLLEAHTGLLVEAGREKDVGYEELVYEFRHLTFQEYLAARALVRGHFQNRILGTTLAQNVAPLAACTAELAFTTKGEKEVAVAENWREALRLIATICHDDQLDDYLKAILYPCAGENPTSRRARAIQATLCIADEPNIGDETVLEIFTNFAECIDHRDRNMEIRTGVHFAAIAIARTRWSNLLISVLVEKFEDLPPLIRDFTGDIAGLVVAHEVLGDSKNVSKWWRNQTSILRSGSETASIISALGIAFLAMTSKHSEFTDQLIDALILRMRGSPAMAHAAAQALANLTWAGKNKAWHPSRQHLLTLLQYLKDTSSDPEAVRFIVQICGFETIKGSFKYLVHWLTHENAELRRVVLSALCFYRSPSAIKTLLSATLDPSEDVRLTALYDLHLLSKKKFELTFQAALTDSSSKVRATAVLCLTNVDCKKSVDHLISSLSDEDKDVRGGAAHALGIMRNKKAIKSLEKTILDSDREVRLAAIHAIGEIGGKDSYDPIIELINDEDAETQICAINALGNIGNRNAINALREKLKNNGTLRYAAEAIAAIGGEYAFESLVSALTDPSATNRDQLASALARGDILPISSLIIDLITNEDDAIKEAGVELAGRLKINAAVDSLISELETKNLALKDAICYALGHIQNKKAEKKLIFELINGDKEYQSATIALGKLKCIEALPHLIEISLTNNDPRQIAAIESVGHIGGQSAERCLQKLLQSASGFIRSCATEALAMPLSHSIRQILTKNFDGKWPYIDPDNVITYHSVRTTAVENNLCTGELISSYESIQTRFRLKLAWSPAKSSRALSELVIKKRISDEDKIRTMEKVD